VSWSKYGKFVPKHLLLKYTNSHKSGEEDGAFAEYAMIRDGHVAKIPKDMTFEETSTLGVGLSTVGQTLYMTLKLPLPGQKPLEKETFILIYGGSSATGTLAIQCANLYDAPPQLPVT
jgi:NADPH:quinone reductase-like Zn-dependent oxidoreductase